MPVTRKTLRIGALSILLTSCVSYRPNGLTCDTYWSVIPMLHDDEYAYRKDCEEKAPSVLNAKAQLAAKEKDRLQSEADIRNNERKEQAELRKKEELEAAEKTNADIKAAERNAENLRLQKISQHCKRKKCERFEGLAKSKKVGIGMPTELVILSWGNPDAINKTIVASGTREQWIYRGEGSYLYFQYNLLQSIQTSH